MEGEQRMPEYEAKLFQSQAFQASEALHNDRSRPL